MQLSSTKKQSRLKGKVVRRQPVQELRCFEMGTKHMGDNLLPKGGTKSTQDRRLFSCLFTILFPEILHVILHLLLSISRQTAPSHILCKLCKLAPHRRCLLSKRRKDLTDTP